MTATQNAPAQIVSTLTDRYQTTIPEAVRTQLGLSKRDQLNYTIDETGTVTLRRAHTDEHDPALRPFLVLLERDIATHPERLESLEGMQSDLLALTEGVTFDLNAPLDPDDE